MLRGARPAAHVPNRHACQPRDLVGVVDPSADERSGLPHPAPPWPLTGRRLWHRPPGQGTGPALMPSFDPRQVGAGSLKLTDVGSRQVRTSEAASAAKRVEPEREGRPMPRHRLTTPARPDEVLEADRAVVEGPHTTLYGTALVMNRPAGGRRAAGAGVRRAGRRRHRRRGEGVPAGLQSMTPAGVGG